MRDVNMGSIRSVERSIDVLQAFSIEKPALTLDELAGITKLPRSTVYRLLCTLEGRGLVQFNPKSLHYKLGLSLIEFGTVVLSTLDISKEAEAVLTDLHEKIGQTVLMVVKDENEIIYIFKRESRKGLVFSLVVGERRPFTYGVLGPIILAFESDEFIDRILSVPLEKSTPYTVTDKEQFRQRLLKIRQENIFIQSEETSIGVTGIGAPIYDAKEEVIAAIGIVGPTVQLTNDELLLAQKLTLEAARDISVEMGYQGNKLS